MHKDARGLDTTVADPQALDLFEKAIAELQQYQGDPIATLDEALALDENYGLAWCFRACMSLFSMDPSSRDEARRALERGEALLSLLTTREQNHLIATRAWYEGDWHQAGMIWDRILINYPRDLLALKAGYLADFYMGRSQGMRDRVARVLHAWDPKESGYGFVLGMYAFGLEECGDYDRAEEVGREAVSLFASDVWAIHAVAHVLEMRGRISDGIRWMKRRQDDWALDGNFFAVHNWWHLALYQMEFEDFDQVLEIYDGPVRGDNSNIVMDLEDASSLLWRCHLEGVNVGDRWDELADAWEPLAEDALYAFNDIHAMMAFAGAGREKAALAQLDTLTRCAGRACTNGAITRDVGLPLCRALFAFSRGDYGTTVSEMMPIRYAFSQIGGSNAQRDILPLTLIEAAQRDNQHALARAFLAERVALKPQAPASWKHLGKAFQGLGNNEEARHAFQRAEQLKRG